MLGTAAGLALLLAATGIHALLAWSVSRRTREIGIRMAIGATRSDIARIVVRRALQPALAGVAAGITGAVALGAILRTLVVGAERFDSTAFAGSAAILVLVAIIATLVPLSRAVRVDPMTALRME
jgi:putative ABC transport system permease protein